MAMTKRATSPALEALLGTALPVLDHGFVRVVDYMGDDEAIEQAARVSYGAATRAVRERRGLLRYLMRHWHTSPFEMCEIKLHVKLPIFVARQWIRHRTANVNEYSARYSVLANEFYIPNPGDLAPQSTDNKQGRAGELSHRDAMEVTNAMWEHHNNSYALYRQLLNEDKLRWSSEEFPGIARESARSVLPTSTYTEWFWKVDAKNLLDFLRLRADSHAQLEIRRYAEVISEIVETWLPLTFEAFQDYRMNAVTLSAQQLDLLQTALREGLPIAGYDFEEFNLTKRERDDLLAAVIR